MKRQTEQDYYSVKEAFIFDVMTSDAPPHIKQLYVGQS
jgi:hypothetical protein